MRAKELIRLLEDTPNAIVKCYDADVENYIAITGLVLSEDQEIITLQTDED